MRRNPNLELCLFPNPPYDVSAHNHNQSPIQNHFHHQQQQQLQPLTIFYDGKISVITDVTELQAKSILMLANGSSEPCTPTTILQSPHHQLYSPGTGLSMKRSLQRFLQKRKNRVQQASPYYH